MAFTIGLRFYKFYVHELKNGAPLRFKAGDTPSDPFQFLKPFLQSQSTFVDQEDAQRSWSLEERSGTGSRDYWSIARYGTYGFASKLRDRKTGKENYDRKVGDLEEIPLFLHFWAPDSGDFGLAAFQSFQGRSCIQLIMGAISSAFEAEHKGHRIRFVKVSPDTLTGGSSYKAPIKRLTLVSRRSPKDKADLLSGSVHSSEYNYEVSLVARRGRVLGSLSEIRKILGTKKIKGGLIHFDGHDYDQAKADVVVNGRRRTIGLIGISSDSGAIDVTEDVEKINGHPTFESISNLSDEMMTEIYEISQGRA